MTTPDWRRDAVRLAKALRAAHAGLVEPCRWHDVIVEAIERHEKMIASIGGAGRCRAGRTERRS
jgi:hypothetical protein